MKFRETLKEKWQTAKDLRSFKNFVSLKFYNLLWVVFNFREI